MGLLTTITIYNDDCDKILKNKKEFAEDVYMCCVDGRFKSKQFNIINQQPKHADNTSLYIHIGNTFIEINPYSDKFLNLKNTNPEFYKEIIKEINKIIKKIK